jgi:hypothetical protein
MPDFGMSIADLSPRSLQCHTVQDANVIGNGSCFFNDNAGTGTQVVFLSHATGRMNVRAVASTDRVLLVVGQSGATTTDDRWGNTAPYLKGK